MCGVSSGRTLLITGLLFLFCREANAAKIEQKVLRWVGGTPGSAFSANSDGTYRYGLSGYDLSVTLAVDSQELDKARRRPEPVIAVFLSFRYSGVRALDLDSKKISMEFVDHFHDRHYAIDPDDLSRKFQADAVAFSDKSSYGQQAAKNAQLDAAAENRREAARAMIEFLGVKALRSATLNSDHPEISGWVFFASRNRWVNDLREQEQFVLRVPCGDLLIEFPFTLPPSRADINLRARPED